jgi:hypothetical protein
MRHSIMMMIVTMTLWLFQSGCSWVMWQHVPEKDTPVEKVECRLAPPIVDSVFTAGSLVGTGVFSGLAAHACDGGSDMCGIGEAIFGGIAAGFAIMAVVWGIATGTGWNNYDKCREYQERVSSTEQFGTGPELFHPSPPNPPPPNSVPSGSSAPPNPGTSIPDP